MPQVDFTPKGLPTQPPQPDQVPNPQAPPLGEVFGAAARQVNDVVSFYNYISRDIYAPDPSFDFAAAAQASPYFLDNQSTLAGAQSLPEFKQIEQQIAQEYADKAMLARGGWAGTFAAVSAGVISPTMYIPFLGEARGAKGVATAFALGGAAATAQESTLFLTQKTRTVKETLGYITAGTILAGTLGSAVALMRPRVQTKLIDALENSTSLTPPKDIIWTPPQDGSLSAAERTGPTDPGQYAGATVATRAAVEKLAKTGPAGRMITRTIDVGAEAGPVSIPAERSMGLAFTDAGLKMQGNAEGIPTEVGGTIEAKRVRHNAVVPRVTKALDAAYSKHFYGEGSKGVGLRAAVTQIPGIGKKFTPKGKLTWAEFNTEVVKALNFQGQHDLPEVVQAATAVRKEYADYFSQEAKRAYEYRQTIDGSSANPMFTEHKFDPTDTSGAPTSYMNHVFDQQKIAKQGVQFEADIAAHVNGQLQKDLGNIMAQHESRVAAFQKQLGDRPVGKTTAFKQTVKLRQSELSGVQNDIRKIAREGGQGSDALVKELKIRADELKGEIDYLRASGESMAYSASQRVLDNLFEDLTAWTAADIARKGGTDIGVGAGTADFSGVSKEIGQRIANSIRGESLRVSGMDMLGASQGPELARMLNMDYAIKSKYLVTNAERLVRLGVRQLGTDVEIYRRFGQVNAANQLNKIAEQYDALIHQASKAASSGQGLVGKTLKKLGKKSRADPVAYLAKLRAQRKSAIEDATTLVTRARYQRGIPKDPNAILYRAGQTAMDASVALKMGMVAISSVPDLGRVPMKWGLLNTYRDGWKEFVLQTPRYKMAKDQAEFMGIGIDPVTHGRLNAIVDQFEAGVNHGPVGKTIRFAANKTGMVALFDYWTAWQKHMTASVVMGEISRGIRLLRSGGGKASERRVYTEMFASFGLAKDHQERIWQQMTTLPKGGQQFGDNWLPNVRYWTDLEARDAYAAALAKAAEYDTIVTPGLERPSWMDENLPYRMVAQFRGFTSSSHTRVMLAGLQDAQHLDRRGMAVAAAVPFSLALGALSYYTSAMAAGGKAWERAQGASIGSVADEAIDRSGLLGWISEGIRMSDKFPGTNGVLRFGDRGVTRRSPNSVTGAILGPSADLADRLVSVAQGVNDPTQSTTHTIRTLMLYNNVFYLRRLFNAVEAGANKMLNIPEKRKKK